MQKVLGHFGHGHFGHGRFGQDVSATDISATDISATDISATDISANGHFGQDVAATDVSATDISATDISANGHFGHGHFGHGKNTYFLLLQMEFNRLLPFKINMFDHYNLTQYKIFENLTVKSKEIYTAAPKKGITVQACTHV